MVTWVGPRHGPLYQRAGLIPRPTLYAGAHRAMIRDRKSSLVRHRPPPQGQIASTADLYFMGPMGISRRLSEIFQIGVYTTKFEIVAGGGSTRY
jgi:hypothetical protein